MNEKWEEAAKSIPHHLINNGPCKVCLVRATCLSNNFPAGVCNNFILFYDRSCNLLQRQQILNYINKTKGIDSTEIPMMGEEYERTTRRIPRSE